MIVNGVLGYFFDLMVFEGGDFWVILDFSCKIKFD